jgi:hypothetical protein
MVHLAEEGVLEEQILAIRARVLGEEHPDTLTSMNNLAVTMQALGDLPNAKTLLMKVLDVTRDVMGKQHPRYSGDLAGVRNLQEIVLPARIRVLGMEHPETLTSIGNLGATLIQTGQTQAGLEMVHQVYEGRRKILGEDHPETIAAARILHSFGAGRI